MRRRRLLVQRAQLRAGSRAGLAISNSAIGAISQSYRETAWPRRRQATYNKRLRVYNSFITTKRADGVIEWAIPYACCSANCLHSEDRFGSIMLQNDFEPRSEENFFQIKAE
jgi:hypothetical protein